MKPQTIQCDVHMCTTQFYSILVFGRGGYLHLCEKHENAVTSALTKIMMAGDPDRDR